MELTGIYELLRLEVKAGEDMFHRDSDPALLYLAQKGNTAIKAFLSGRISWAYLLDVLESLGINPTQYELDIRENFRERGLLWLN